MRSSMISVSIVLQLLMLANLAFCNDNLRVAYQWRQIDFEYRNEPDRQAAIESRSFIPQNVIPVGLEVYRTRLFVTLPRWKEGVPASLAYFDINGKCLILFSVISFDHFPLFFCSRGLRNGRLVCRTCFFHSTKCAALIECCVDFLLAVVEQIYIFYNKF